MLNWKDVIFILKKGLFGFAVFFSAVILIKIIITFFSQENSFSVDLADIYLSMIGFVYSIFIALAKEIKGDKELQKD